MAREHGLRTRECYVCSSPKRGAPEPNPHAECERDLAAARAIARRGLVILRWYDTYCVTFFGVDKGRVIECGAIDQAAAQLIKDADALPWAKEDNG